MINKNKSDFQSICWCATLICWYDFSYGNKLIVD